MTNEKKKPSGWKRKAAIVALGLAAIVGGYELVAYYTAPDFSSLKERIYAASTKDAEAQECIRWITEFEKDRGAYRDAVDNFNEGMKMGKNFSNMNGNKQSIIEWNMNIVKALEMDPDNLTDEDTAIP